MSMFVEGLQGIAVIADDILVYGEGQTIEDATKDHDEKWTKLLDKCKTTGIKINKEKIKLRLKEITYIGHLLTENGL